MRQVESKHPAGTVGYIQANRPRFQKFFDSVEQLYVPNGFKRSEEIEQLRRDQLDNIQVPTGTALERASNYNAAHNRNELVCGIEGEWILFLDDDHVFEDNALLRLLDRDVDVATGLYCRKYPPFDPTVYHRFDSKNHKIELYTWEGLSEESGLLEIEACGAGFLLVKKKVLEAMEPPYFRVGGSHWREWSLEKDVIGEDTGFIERARELGFKCYVDLDVSIGHIPDEPILVAMRQKHNGAFNIMCQIGQFNLWLLTEQKRQKQIVVANEGDLKRLVQ